MGNSQLNCCNCSAAARGSDMASNASKTESDEFEVKAHKDADSLDLDGCLRAKPRARSTPRAGNQRTAKGDFRTAPPEAWDAIHAAFSARKETAEANGSMGCRRAPADLRAAPQEAWATIHARFAPPPNATEVAIVGPSAVTLPGPADFRRVPSEVWASIYSAFESIPTLEAADSDRVSTEVVLVAAEVAEESKTTVAVALEDTCQLQKDIAEGAEVPETTATVALEEACKPQVVAAEAAEVSDAEAAVTLEETCELQKGQDVCTHSIRSGPVATAVLEKFETIEEVQKQQGLQQCGVLPFGRYYIENFSPAGQHCSVDLYSKFQNTRFAAAPAPQPQIGVVPFREYYRAHFPSMVPPEFYTKFPSKAPMEGSAIADLAAEPSAPAEDTVVGDTEMMLAGGPEYKSKEVTHLKADARDQKLEKPEKSEN